MGGTTSERRARAGFVGTAESIARRAHEGQTDKAGKPYIEHPAWVAAHVDGDEARAAAWLHDVLEDTDATADDLARAGIPERVVAAVRALTHAPGESYEEYLARVAGDPLAVRVKLADLAHNSDLSRIPCPTERDRERAAKYRRAVAFLQRRKGDPPCS